MTDLDELIIYWQVVLSAPTTVLNSNIRDRIEETIMFLEKLKQSGGQ